MPPRRRDELQIFAQMANIASPPWDEFYRECSLNKLPNKVKVVAQNGIWVITFRKSNRTILCQLPSHTDSNEVDRVTTFFKNEVGVAIESQTTAVIVEKKQKPLIRRLLMLKALRNLYLRSYTREYAKRENLTETEEEQLFATIVMGWLSGNLQPKESIKIEVTEDGGEYISDIVGIERDQNGVFYFRPSSDTPRKTRTSTRKSTAKKGKSIQEQYDIYLGIKPRSKARESCASAMDEDEDLDEIDEE